MSEDVCFEALLEICAWIVFSILFEIGVAVLMSMGYSRITAEGMLTSSVCLLLLVLGVVFELLRRKKLGKAVVLDTDGDGEISEEEWAAAGQDMDEDTDEEEASVPSSEDGVLELEKDGSWWEEGEEGK
ncbi:MAG: hypothetical protein QF709_01425 [Candidatus Thalassarchaeum sp.]|nr:hypothetical protein [Candidatus Thalassarchaeum sp.]